MAGWPGDEDRTPQISRWPRISVNSAIGARWAGEVSASGRGPPRGRVRSHREVWLVCAQDVGVPCGTDLRCCVVVVVPAGPATQPNVSAEPAERTGRTGRAMNPSDRHRPGRTARTTTLQEQPREQPRTQTRHRGVPGQGPHDRWLPRPGLRGGGERGPHPRPAPALRTTGGDEEGPVQEVR